MDVENKQPKQTVRYGDVDGFAPSGRVMPRGYQTVTRRHFITLDNSHALRERAAPQPQIVPPQQPVHAIVTKPEAAPQPQPQPRQESVPTPASNTFTLDLPQDTTAPKKRKSRRHSKKHLLLSSTLAVLLVLFSVGGFLGYRTLFTIHKVFHSNIINVATAAFHDAPLKGESDGRVNILLAGDSADQLGHGGAQLTDSILVLSIDTNDHTAFMLSIPRDLWVNIPGYGWQKINAANNGDGTNFPGYPQNGMGQLEHVVTSDLGIPIDYYALSDYGAFKDAVNAVGGVTVDIQSTDPRGLYDAYTNLRIPNGEDALDGQEALNLARARGDGAAGDISYGFPDTDFTRTMHQRQLFTAIAEKAKSLGFLDNPLKISNLLSAFSNNVQTDMTLQNVLRLAQITKGMDLSNIQSYAYCATMTPSCSPPILTNYTDPKTKEEALSPIAGISDYSQMTQYYEQLSSDNPVVREGASVDILNGSSVTGLAKEQSNVLIGKGVSVPVVTDANGNYPSNMIVDNSGGKDPATLSMLEQQYPGSTVVNTTTASPEAASANNLTSTFVVIIGQDWANANSSLVTQQPTSSPTQQP